MINNTDPKQAAGIKKTPLGLIPAPAMEEIANVLKLGASKYGESNWRNYISEKLCEMWDTFTDEQKLAIAENAEEQANSEEWD